MILWLPILAVWSALAMTWWVIALRLVRTEAAPQVPPAPASGPMLSVFKPLPKLHDPAEAAILAKGIASFVTQLDVRTELLLGVLESDRAIWKPWIERWSAAAPGAIVAIERRELAPFANPKIAWQHALAPHARGDLWMWSDADIIAPAGFITTARAELAENGHRVVTNAYVVDVAPCAAGLPEALFVNVEFSPGARLLGRLDAVRFGFGAAMLFRAEDFRNHVRWDDLGAHLAEDYVLGRRLQPVRLGSTVLRTFSHSVCWRQGVQHYLRWLKTIRWCRPGGFAAQLMILPLLGWAAWIVAAPTEAIAWTGASVTWVAEVAVARALCHRAGCRIGWRRMWVVGAWSALRGVAWLACWLPWPVRWRDRLWWSPSRVPADVPRWRRPRRRPAAVARELAAPTDSVGR